MAEITFAESQSADPTERSIARRVARILQDRRLGENERTSLVRQAQQELLQHRSHQDKTARIQALAKAAPLPQGYQACSVTIDNGRVMVGALNAGQRFVWIDAGPEPRQER